MKIPIIILNYNSEEDCRKCVSFLKKQQGVETEIILVDNCSRAENLETLRTLAAEQQCTLLENKENLGYNAGNNIGLRYASEKGYKYALISNPDMEFPQEDYVASVVNKMEENEEIVVCGSDIIDVDDHHQNPMFKDKFFHDVNSIIKVLFKRKGSDTDGNVDNYKDNHYCAKVSGCCFLLRMDFVKEIGFFDDNVFLYCEEAILSRQVEIAGKKMYYIADSQAVHAHISSTKGNPVKRFENWESARMYFIDRYSGYNVIKKMTAKFLVRLYVLAYKLYKK
ncbi:glycosyltransferase family 2 protein [Coprobacter fastidiosus]|uniref:glycosyltransferase family 2 protein n=1 Tax=Coprobacter fastidiosus TaxID=1099853 RepID=UPI0022E7A4A3|nr:glycosyltransferase family 2 protein [Coprobacter fastidiosus]